MSQNSNEKADAQSRSKANCMGLSAAEQSRRDFLKTSAVAGGVALGGLGGFYFGYDMTHGDPIRVGVIGTGDEGNVLLGAINPEYVDVRSIADIRPFGVHRAFHGDVSSPLAMKVRKGLMKVYGWKTEAEARRHVKVYGPWQDLIRNAKADGLEAVIIALPLHLHAPVAIIAMREGLHVLTEKLMGHSVGNCKEMARTADQTGKHLATGHQRHYNILYHEAVDAIQRGRLGDLHYIRAQWHRGNRPGSDSWQQPMPRDAKPSDSQAERLEKEARALVQALKSATGSDIELTQKKLTQKMKQIEDVVLTQVDSETGRPAVEDLGYQAANIGGYDRPAIEELIRWRLWDRTGGGLMAELGSHQLDAASIFIAAMHGGKKQAPLSVSAAASRTIFDADREANDHVMCTVEFATPEYEPECPVNSRKKVTVQYSSINGNGFGGYGEVVYGTRGTLIIEREQKKTLLEEEKKTRVSASKGAALDTQASGPAQKAAVAADREVSRGYQEEIEHWAWCIRKNPNNEPGSDIHPRCYPKVALGDAVIALTANIAARDGQRIDFKPEWFDIDSDETPEGVAPNLDREEYKL